MRCVLLARRTLMAAQPAQRLATDTRCAAAVDAHTAELRAQKDMARRAMRATLRAIGKETLEEDSRLAVQRLLASSAFASSRRVGVYVSCERLREVNTHELLRVLLQPGALQHCFAPLVGDAQAQMEFYRIDALGDLVASTMGILEPRALDLAGLPRENASASPLDLIVVPGVAFDAQGRRLGRGGGYYDAFFRRDAVAAIAQQRPRALRVALALDAQILDAVPFDAAADRGDELVDVVLTPTRVLGPGAGAWK